MSILDESRGEEGGLVAVIENDSDTRNGLRDIVEGELGLRVVTGGNAKDGIAALLQKPDIVILDDDLGDTEGTGLDLFHLLLRIDGNFTEVRAGNETTRVYHTFTPVIVLSGAGRDPSEYPSEMYKYIMKPPNLDLLLSHVKAGVATRRLRILEQENLLRGLHMDVHRDIYSPPFELKDPPEKQDLLELDRAGRALRILFEGRKKVGIWSDKAIVGVVPDRNIAVDVSYPPLEVAYIIKRTKPGGERQMRRAELNWHNIGRAFPHPAYFHRAEELTDRMFTGGENFEVIPKASPRILHYARRHFANQLQRHNYVANSLLPFTPDDKISNHLYSMQDKEQAYRAVLTIVGTNLRDAVAFYREDQNPRPIERVRDDPRIPLEFDRADIEKILNEIYLDKTRSSLVKIASGDERVPELIAEFMASLRDFSRRIISTPGINLLFAMGLDYNERNSGRLWGELNPTYQRFTELWGAERKGTPNALRKDHVTVETATDGRTASLFEDGLNNIYSHPFGLKREDQLAMEGFLITEFYNKILKPAGYELSPAELVQFKDILEFFAINKAPRRAEVEVIYRETRKPTGEAEKAYRENEAHWRNLLPYFAARRHWALTRQRPGQKLRPLLRMLREEMTGEKGAAYMASLDAMPWPTHSQLRIDESATVLRDYKFAANFVAQPNGHTYLGLKDRAA